MVFHFIWCYSFYYLVHFLNIKIFNIIYTKLDTRLDHLEIDQGFEVYERRKPA